MTRVKIDRVISITRISTGWWELAYESDDPRDRSDRVVEVDEMMLQRMFEDGDFFVEDAKVAPPPTTRDANLRGANLEGANLSRYE